MKTTTLAGKLVLSFLLLYFSCFDLYAQCEFAAGDLAFTGYQIHDDDLDGSTQDDSFSFVLLRDTPEGQEIFFTDKGWINNRFQTLALAPTDGMIKWMAPAGGLSAGTQVVVQAKYGLTATAGSITPVEPNAEGSYLSLGLGGDQLFAFTGNPSAPLFLAGITVNKSAWDSDPMLAFEFVSSSSSFLPAALNSVQKTIIANSTGDSYNAILNPGSFSGTAIYMAALLNQPASWSTDATAYPNPIPTVFQLPSKAGFQVVGPSVTKEPVAYLGCPDGTAYFTVETGNSCLITWQSSTDGTSFTDLTEGGVYAGVNSASLTITNVNGLNQTYYRAKVKGSAMPLAYSVPVQLTIVLEAPTLTAPTGVNAVTYGLPQTSFSVTGSEYVRTYQWQVSSDGVTYTDLSESEVYSGTTTEELSIHHPVVAMDGLQYRVQGTDHCGEVVTSEVIGLSVAPYQLEASLTGNISKIYDRSTTASLVLENYSLTPALGDDVVGLDNYTSGSFDTPDAGSEKTISVSGLTLSGADAENYQLKESGLSASIGEILPAPVSVALTGSVSREYDGSTSAALTAANYSVEGILNADDVILENIESGNFDSKAVGTGKTISVTGLSLSGTAAANYELLTPDISGPIGSISAQLAEIALTGPVVKDFDGNKSATLTDAHYTLSGILEGDEAVLAGHLAGLFDSPDPGTGKTVSVTGISLSGADGGNYALSASSLSAPVGTIIPPNTAPVVTAPEAPIVNEDAKNVALSDTFMVSDADGDDLELTFSMTGGSLHLGSTGISFGGSGNGSDSFTASGTLEALNTALKEATFTPTPDLYGSKVASISLVASDGLAGSLIASVSFDILGVNDDPVISDLPAAITVTEDSTSEPFTLSSAEITDIDAEAGALTLSLTATGGIFDIAAGTGVTITGHLTSHLTLTGNLTDLNKYLNIPSNIYFRPSANLSGMNAASVEVSINDNGNTGSGGGTSLAAGNIQVHISPVNDAPVVTLPASINVLEDVASPLTGISFSDPDAGTGSVSVVMTVPNGSLSAVSGSGVTVGGTETSMSFQGTLSDINAFLAASSVTFVNQPENIGNQTLTVSVNDNGNTGTGGPLTDIGSVTLTVTPAAPVVTRVEVPEDGTYGQDQELEFLVHFNKNMIANTSEGTPYLSLLIGSSSRQASLISGSGTSVLHFRYRVQEGDSDPDGIAINGLTLNGGSLANGNGTSANLILNNVESTAAVLVDALAPSGYAVVIDQDPILTTNQEVVSFSFSGAEIGADFSYAFTSSGGGTPVTGSGTITTATDQVTGIDLSGLNPGDITLGLRLQDALGNTGEEASDTSIKRPQISAAITASPVLCHGGADGSLSVQVTQGRAPYQFTWSTGLTATSAESSHSISALTAGDYSVTVIDADGQEVTASGSITEPALASLTTTAASGITYSGATLGGTVTGDNGCEKETGIVYSTTPNPTITDTKVVMPVTADSFGQEVTGLQVNTTYYARAFSTNKNNVTSYGNEINFTTATKELTVTATEGQTKVYGQADPAFAFTATGFLPGDDSSVFSGALSREAGEDVGSYAILQGNLSAGPDYHLVYTGADFEVTPAAITGITFPDASFVYDSGLKSLAIEGSLPEGSSVAYSNNGRTTVGSQTVTATVSGANYLPLELSAILSITPATITGVSFEDSSVVYDGTAHSIFVTGMPEGASVTYENNGQTNAGIYEVTATVSQENYNDLVLTAELNIEKAMAIITTAALQSFIYDGELKEVSAALNHSETALVYNPQQAYINAGTYDITISSEETANYQAASEEVSLVIEKAEIKGVAFEDASFTYDGTAHSIFVTGMPEGASVAYENNGQTNAGLYEVTATVSQENYNDLVLTAELNIEKAVAIITAAPQQSFIYDGELKEVSAQLNHSETALVYSPQQGYVEAGTYGITVSSEETANYLAASEEVSLVIEKAEIEGVAFADASFTYNGTAHSIFVTGMPEGASVTYENNGKINAGIYAVTATVSQENYNDLVLTAELNIEKAVAIITTAAVQSFIYNGELKEVSAQLNHSETALVYSPQQGYVEAGTYGITVSSEETANYLAASEEVSLVIEKAEIEGVVFADASFTYNGTAHSIFVTGMPKGASVTYENNGKIIAGIYAVTATVSQENYNDLVLTAEMNIEKAVAIITAAPQQSFIYDGELKEVSAALNHSETLLVYSPQQAYINAGTYDITISSEETANYLAASEKVSLVIEKAEIEGVAFADASFTYDGTAHSIFVTGTREGASVAYENNGQTNAGVYEVTATVSQENYNDLVLTASLIINKAPQVITFAELEDRYQRTDKSLQLNATSSSGLPVTYTYTYSTEDPAATVSANGFVRISDRGEITITASQPGNQNYEPAIQVVRVLRIIGSEARLSAVNINGTIITNPSEEIYYQISCGDMQDQVSIQLQAIPGASMDQAAEFSMTTPAPGIYRRTVTLTSEDGLSTRTYQIRVEKNFGFEDIVVQKFNNVLLVNNNPQTNGGYKFVSYRWFRNGSVIGNGQYYSAGNNMTDLLDTQSLYHVELETEDGEVLKSCPSQIDLTSSFRVSLTPNPVRAGESMELFADFPQEELEHMELSIHNLNGVFLRKIESKEKFTSLSVPGNLQAGVYLLRVQTPNISRTLKFIVKN